MRKKGKEKFNYEKNSKKHTNKQAQKAWLKSTKTWIMYNLRRKRKCQRPHRYRKRRKSYKKFWQLLKKGQTNWEKKFYKSLQQDTTFTTFESYNHEQKPILSPIIPGAQSSPSADLELRPPPFSPPVITKRKTFQLFPNENSNQTPFRQFQPGDLDKENLQRPEFGDPLDKLRPPEGRRHRTNLRIPLQRRTNLRLLLLRWTCLRLPLQRQTNLRLPLQRWTCLRIPLQRRTCLRIPLQRRTCLRILSQQRTCLHLLLWQRTGLHLLFQHRTLPQDQDIYLVRWILVLLNCLRRIK